MSELKNALKPLMEALNSQSATITGVNATLQEMYQLIISVEKRLEVVESLFVQGFRPASGSRKAIARRGAKKTEPEAEDAEDAEEEPQVEAVVETSEDTKQQVTDDADAEEEDAQSEASNPKPAAKPIKPTKKAKAKPAPKAKIFNKLNYFKNKFKEDETQFNHIFTPKIRKELDASDKLKGLTGNAAQNARITVYWEYISKDDDGQELLEAAKREFQEANE